MGRPISTVASRINGKRLPWVPVLAIAVVFMATATVRAETGRIALKIRDNDVPLQDAEVSIHTPSGESLGMQARTNKAGSATFVVPAGSYKFCVDHYGDRTWSYVVHTLPDEETEVKLALEQLAKDKTLDPHPIRFDGTPPEQEPVMLASLVGLSGILTQSTVAAVSKDRLYWFVNDHLGTPMMIVDENQEIVWQGSAMPFGETSMTVNSFENNFRFPGQYFDAESGLHYNYYRYYDYSTGRYLIADPIGLNGGINLFAYTNLNPINLIDLFGLDESWRVLSRSMSATGGVPPGIKSRPIPWREYGEVLQPSKQSLSSTKRAAMIFTTASYTVGNVPAAGVFIGIGSIATALESTLYSKTPCNDAIKEGAKSLVPAPPLLVPIKDEMVDKAIDMYIEHNDLPQM